MTKTSGACLAIALAAVAAYANAFAAPFIFDDLGSIAHNPTIRHLWPLWPVLSPPGGAATVEGRPLLNLSFAANYAISRTAVWSYHLVNLVIHILAGFTLFGIVRRTARSWPVGLATALIWTLHPLQTEAVTYLVQRSESMMGLFYLLTLYCFIRWNAGFPCDLASAPSPRRSPPKGQAVSLWPVLSTACCACGMATKEVMVTAPVMVFLYDRTFVAGSFHGAWRQRRRYYLCLAATWLVLAVLVADSGGNRSGSKGFGTGVSWIAWELTQANAIVHYLRLAVWPRPLIFGYSPFWTDLRAAAPHAALLAILAGATFWALGRAPRLGFLGFWFFGILAVTSLLPANSDMIAERRMYLPLAAIVTLSVCLAHALLVRLRRRRPGAICLAFFLPVAAVLGRVTSERNRDYRSAISIWSDTVAKLPDDASAHNNLALVLLGVPGRVPDAVAEFEKALRLRPDYAGVHCNLANVLATMPGHFLEASAHYREALRINPNSADVHYNFADALARIPGRMAEALDHYEQVERIDPNFSHVQTNLGMACATVGRFDEARRHWEQALRHDPHDQFARDDLEKLRAVNGGEHR